MPFSGSGQATVTRQRAVTGQDVLADQVNIPFDDIQAMLSQTFLRNGAAPATGNFNMNGFKLTNVGLGTSDTDLVTVSQLAAAGVPTGQIGEFYLTAAPNGWVQLNGGTIGNIASGATRANADTFNLFVALWAFSNTLLPIQDSSGSASTRGVSATADYNANKRLPVFDDTDLFRRGSGANAVGVFQDQAFIAHTHGVNETPHSHNWGNTARAFGLAVGTTGAFAQGGSTPGDLNTASALTGITIQSAGTDETRPKNRSVLVCIKL